MTWVLGLLGSPVGRYIGIALAVLAFVSWQRHDAASDARAEAEAVCRATFEERVDTEVERQRQVTETVLERAQEQLERSEQEATRLQEEADALLEELEERGEGGRCPLDDDTRRRLLDIR